MNKRIIPCMDIRGGRVVKGIKFEGLKDVEDPAMLAEYYDSSGADELVFYDISASTEARGIDLDLFKKVAEKTKLPLTAGGAINTLGDIERVLVCGASKVSINTGAIKDKSLISSAAKNFGSQRIMLAIDASNVNGRYNIFTGGGKTDTGIDALEWVIKGEADGAGEIVVNSIDADGTKDGFDLKMLSAILKKVKIPIIASGGAGGINDFVKLFSELPHISAGLAASIFHFKEVDIFELKKVLMKNNIPVNL